MNDLEHDLRELFERRASGVDAPGLAPKDVMRRGRRRQVGTIVTGVLACLVAAGIAAAAVGEARHPAVIPGEGNGLPARTTSIGGVPVTAPAGWTLVDDWPLAAILPTTSESCSFSGTGTPVNEKGSPTAGSEGDGGSTETQATQPCTTTSTLYAAGIPVLQLANFEIPLMGSVCGHGNYQPQASIPDDGVAVYVADDQAQANIPAFLDACAGSGGSPVGEPQTFFDVGHHTDYIAIALAGPDATDADVDAARGYVDTLSGLEVSPAPPAVGHGPGYVMATGQGGGVSWHLEAGITSFDRQDGTPTVGAVMATTTAADTGSRTVALSTSQRVNDDYVDLGGQGVVQFGTASADVTGIDIADPNGGAVPAALISWPDQLASLPGLDTGPTGWLWFAEASKRGSLDVHAPTGSSAPSAPRVSEPGALRTTEATSSPSRVA